jgi:hypothetical protein
MKRVAMVLAVLTLLTAVLVSSCVTLEPFTETDYQQIEKVLKPYKVQWGDYAYIEIHLRMGREGWVGFLWLAEDQTVTHLLMLSYFNDEWIVIQER